MILTLRKLTLNKTDPAIVHLSIAAEYTWNEKLLNDIIRIQYNRKNHEVYLALKIDHPGIGAVISRIAESLSRITDYRHLKIDPVQVILEQLNHELDLQYDALETEEILQKKY